MKKSLVLASLLVVSLAVMTGSLFAGTTETKGANHELTVEFVSFDAKAATVTFKDDAGEQKTVPVLASAKEKFAGMKAGAQVVLTCADDEKGAHLGVSDAKPATKKA